jgi:hypothetical protein
MELKGALIKISDNTFGIVEVNNSILADDSKANAFMKKCAVIFPRVPIVLVAYNELGKPVYYGKKQIIQLLTNIHPRQIPWKIYSYK